jgi:hypothetical protein
MGHAARMIEMGNAYKILIETPEGRRPFGRPRRQWEDNIRMDVRETRWKVVDWSHLIQDRDQWRAYVKAVMNLRLHKRQGISLLAK